MKNPPIQRGGTTTDWHRVDKCWPEKSTLQGWGNREQGTDIPKTPKIKFGT